MTSRVTFFAFPLTTTAIRWPWGENGGGIEEVRAGWEPGERIQGPVACPGGSSICNLLDLSPPNLLIQSGLMGLGVDPVHQKRVP